MSEQSRKNNASKFVRSIVSSSASTYSFTGLKGVIKRNASLVAGVFSLAAAILIIWVWGLLTSPGAKASVSSTPAVSSDSNLNNSLSAQTGTTLQSSNGSTDVTVQRTGDAPASVTVNGQPVRVPQNGSVHKQVGGTSVDVQTSNGSATNGNTSSTTIISNSTSSVNSSSHVSNFSFSTGSGTPNK